MKEIIVNNKTYLFVEVLDKAYDFKMRRNNQVIFLLKDVINPLTGSEKSEIIKIPNVRFGLLIKDLQIISTTKDITEEQCKNLVEFIEFNEFEKYSTSHYYDYTNTNKWEYTESGSVVYGFKTAKESLNSLIQANGLDINKNYIILLLNN